MNFLASFGLTVAFLSPLLAATTAAASAMPQVTAGLQVSPVVSRCDLETTQRVSFRLEKVPQEAIAVGLQLHFYDAQSAWMADEIVLDSGASAPILPVAGLFDPRKVASVTCSVDGYVGSMDQRGFVSVQPPLTSGRKTCPEKDGLDVDGGPDAEIDAAVIGRTWLMVQLLLSINHFFPNQETEFHGDSFAAVLDRGAEQKLVVTGQDPQTVSWLFTDLRPGLHQVDYGPWAVFDAVQKSSPGFSRGYHNFCLQI